MDQEAPALSPLPKWAREAGAEPLPGYRLIEPLGRGGFGEVWKCEAPGGLFKAIKFVPNQDDQGSPANQEREALQRIKAIRHPFILSLDRVEVVEGVLVIVMELADKSLHGLLADYQSRNLPGIPRDELLGYLLEAAEALDWMNLGHGLQHLDIKPHNLFLVSNHVKVADFGLVDSLPEAENGSAPRRRGGMTPLYASPELLCGSVSRNCDQYSLAIVYQQLLTGTLPFWGGNVYELITLHLTEQPNLTPLPAEDRPIVARALSKYPEQRFPSCLDFLQALVCGGESGVKVDLPRRASAVKKMVSGLRGLEKPTKSLRRAPAPTEPAPKPRSPSERSSFATVPASQTSEGRTPASGVTTVPHPPLACKSSTPARPRRATAAAPAPTGISLPGYHFLHRISQNPLGDVWRVEDEQGRPRRALCLHRIREHDPSLNERLQALSHPALPPAEVVWSPEGRLVLVTEEFEQTLRDRLDACQKQGLPGVPREELLSYLRTIAEALDDLHRWYGLPHLGLNPAALVLQKETVWLTDFGLVPLVGLPGGQTIANLNGRYAAPELLDKPVLPSGSPEEAAWSALRGQAGSAADQYSLALIYAEMLNGMPPRSPRPASGLHRRSASGQYRKVGRGDPRIGPTNGQPRLDLDLLPSSDQNALAQALQEDPEQRFPSCTALIDALEAAASPTSRPVEDLYDRLPIIISFATLQGEPPPGDLALPAVREIAIALATPTSSGSLKPPRTILGSQNVRYVMQKNDLWECKCPVQIFSGGLALKVQGFRTEWQAHIVHETEHSYIFQIDLHPPGRSPEPNDPPPPRVIFELHVQSVPGSPKHYAEACLRVRPSEEDPDRIMWLLPELAPRMFDSMRRYLQAAPEQRCEDRWQCPQPLHVYPVRPDLELDEILEGISRNISPGGVSFRVSKAPRTEQVYLHWHKSAAVSRFAVLARIIRVQPMIGGGFEVGAAFPQTEGAIPKARLSFHDLLTE